MQIEIRGRGFGATAALAQHVERRLLFALGRFGERVEEVVVRLEDVNGPRGGIDKECRLQLRLAPWGSLEVEERRADLYAAIDVAAQRLGRAVARELARRRDARDGVRPQS